MSSDSYGALQKVYVVSERANESIQQLSSALEQLNPDEEEKEEEEAVRASDGSFFTNMNEEDKTAWSQKTQSEAGDSCD